MRVTQHCGREGSARHNDRSFQNSPDGRNIYWSWNGEAAFADAERHYYSQAFAPGLESTNLRYIQQRHQERVRTMEDVYTNRQTRPEEVILQIGDMTNAGEVSREALLRCVTDYVNRLVEWSNRHGQPLIILDLAIHMDETSPHCHLRRVWQYEDAEGHLRPGQTQALRQAGIPLPDPTQSEGRYNNRKIEFDRRARHLWQEICRTHGFGIDTEPLPERRRHKSVKDYKRDQQLSQREAWRRWEQERSR